MMIMEGKELRKAVTTAALGAASGKGRQYGAPILECVLIDAAEGMVRASAYNARECVRVSLAGSTNGDRVRAAVPAKEFLGVLKGFRPSDPVSLGVALGYLEVSSNGVQRRIEVIDADEVPEGPRITAEWQALADGKALAGALAQVLPAASSDEARPVLQSVFLEAKGDLGQITLTGVDGFRLHQQTISANVPSDQRVIIPASSIKALGQLIKAQGYGEVAIWIEGEYLARFIDEGKEDRGAVAQKIMFTCGDAGLTVVGMDGTYPEYENIIPKDPKIKVTVNRDGLLRACEAIEKAPALKDHAVRLQIKGGTEGKGTCRVWIADSAQSGKEASLFEVTLPASKHVGADIQIAFNAGFVAEVMKAVPEDKNGEVTLLLTSANIPLVIRASSPAGPFLAVIMPMHLG